MKEGRRGGRKEEARRGEEGRRRGEDERGWGEVMRRG